MSLKYNDIKGTKTAVSCQTQEEADEVRKISGNYNNKCWAYYKKDFCLSLLNDSYASKEWYSSNEYTIINASDFIKSNTEWKLPEKWVIKGSEEFKKWLLNNKYDGKAADIYGNVTEYYYHHLHDEVWMHERFIRDGYTEITIDQLISVENALKQPTMDTVKTIIGYKLLKGLPDVSVGTIGKTERNEVIFDTIAGTRRYDIGIVKSTEWFEAVYKDKFIVGDIIFDEKYGIGKIEKIDDRSIYLNPGFSSGTVDFNICSSIGIRVRKATQEQIDTYLKIEIDGYIAKQEGSLITFGCYKFSEQQLLAYKHLLNQDGNLAKIHVKDTEITVDIINKLLNLLKWK